ncbi:MULTISPECIES: iron uptake porin [unclassified Synechocystis]|uniref:iron uptake porin n=1 Tax=unclassified Synechocystis TaxID=2640012 RepID=UPI000423FABC|nr:MULTISPECIES: iron uptake porin [unclassified Synechocystis]AIE73146.1 Zinc-regulated outer membrane porin [Synechocystis sp. PCC 6714]
MLGQLLLVWGLGALMAIAFGTNQLVQAQMIETSTSSNRLRLDGFLDDRAEPNSLSQITSVSELRDVQPTAWAYEALQSLVERYGCIVGYPDRTFRGDRALSRWEFAAGLNACMNVMERLVQENVAVLREDIDKLKRLAQEFEGELAALGTRIDNLEVRTSYLEDHQFSTTTKLSGQVVMALGGIVSGDKNNGTEAIARNTTLGYRSRLELNTSFRGDDDLFIRLSSGTLADYGPVAGTFQPVLGATEPEDGNLSNSVLYYTFPATENIRLWALAAGGAFDDFTNTVNILDGDGAFGALTSFGTRSPIYFLGEGTGAALQGTWDRFQLSLGYLASTGNDPSQGEGLFNGGYGTIAQLNYDFSDNLTVALTYGHGYNTLDTGTGSQRSNFRYFTETTFGEAANTSHNAYGAALSWQLSDYFILGGWGGVTKARTLNAINFEDTSIRRGSLDIWNWAVTLAFPDIFKEDNLAGIIVGMQPWVSSSSIVFPDDIATTDVDSSVYLEGFFQWAVNDNLSITPGIVVVPNADYNNANGTLVLGVIRTTFSF